MRSALRSIRETLHPLFYLRKSRLARRAIARLDFTVSLRIPNVSFRVRGLLITHGLAYAVTGSQEPNPERLFAACLEVLPIRSFWDVGANIGLYTWLIKTKLPDVNALMFEPLPMNIALITETLRRNRLTGVDLLKAAVSDREGAPILRTDDIAGATSSLEDSDDTFTATHWGAAPGRLEVRAVTIDGERSKHGRVDLIKIDVEGHESSVLQGACRTIKEDWPVLFVECTHSNGRCLTSALPQDYRIVNADKLIESDLGGATNFFAFPPRYANEMDSILSIARAHG